MTARFALLLAAALAGLAAPALAQDAPLDEQPPLEPAAEAAPPLPEPSADAPTPLPAAPTIAPASGWQGEWQGEWAADGTYNGTWSGTYADPGPTAARAIESPGVAAADPGPTAARVIEPAGFAAATPEHLAALERCRMAYVAAGGAAGAAAADCEATLQQYELASAVQGASSGNPVMWLRVPIVRQPVAP